MLERPIVSKVFEVLALIIHSSDKIRSLRCLQPVLELNHQFAFYSFSSSKIASAVQIPVKKAPCNVPA